jgi:hypothetical protein
VKAIRRLRLTPNKDPSLETLSFSKYFSGSCIPSNKHFIYIDSTHIDTGISRLKYDELSDEY